MSSSVSPAPGWSPPDSSSAALQTLHTLWRHKGLFCFAMLVAYALGAVAYFLLPPMYRSNCQILVTKKRPEGIPIDSHVVPEDYVATQQGVIQSPMILEQAVKLGKLSERPTIVARLGEGDLVEFLTKKLSVTRSKDSMGIGTNILTVSVKAPTGDDANAILAALFDAYRRTVAEIYSNSSDTTVELVHRAKNELLKEIGEKQAAYREFRKSAAVHWKGKEGVNLHQDRLEQLEAKRTTLLSRQAEVFGQLTSLRKAIDAGASRESLLAMAAELAVKPDAEWARQGQSSKWQEQLLTLLAQEKKLLEKFGESHPEVVTIRKNLATTREFLNNPTAPFAEGDGVKSKAPADAIADPVRWRMEALKQELDYLKTTEGELSRLAAQARDAAKEHHGIEVQDEIHRSNIVHSQQLFDTVLKRIQDANLAKEAGGLEVRMIAAPGTDGVRKAQPSLLLIGSLATFMGLMFGAGLVTLAEARATRTRTPEEIAGRYGFRTLGRIPAFRPSGTGDQATMLVTAAEAQSPASEAFRGWRTSLFFGSAAQKRVLQVASPGHGEGKTLLSANLAVALAQAGKSVVAVDADLGDPGMRNLFRLPSGPGLLAALQGHKTLDEALVAGPAPGLFVLAAEHAVTPSADVIGSSAFEELLKTLRSRFDYVILDSPPLLALSDAAALAGRTDGVLLVIHQTRTGSAEADRAAAALADIGAPVLGVVANGVASHEAFSGYVPRKR